MGAIDVTGAGAVDAAGAAAKTVAVAGVVVETGVVAEITEVVVATTGGAAQTVEEPHAHEENIATSATATSISGVSAQNCCASAARRIDTTSSIARS